MDGWMMALEPEAESEANPVRLDEILARRAADPAEGGRVYVAGGWVPRVASVPLDNGVAAVVRFADRCYRKLLALQLAEFRNDRIEAAERDERLAQIRERHGGCQPSVCDQRWLIDYFAPSAASELL